eukprot:6780260-Pyramimonas_sp.AAC.1
MFRTPTAGLCTTAGAWAGDGISAVSANGEASCRGEGAINDWAIGDARRPGVSTSSYKKYTLKMNRTDAIPPAMITFTRR